MSTFTQIDLKNALVLYAQQFPAEIQLTEEDCWILRTPEGSLTGARSGYASISQVEWLHATVVKPSEAQLISLYDSWVLSNQAGEALALQTSLTELSAKASALAIPSWAHWTEQQALDWHNTNITTLLPVANLAAANTVLQRLDTENRALIRMVIALRNKAFPDLQG